MNGKVAKRLRKEAYGDLSLKADREYIRSEWYKHGRLVNHPDSPRAVYQKLKKRHYDK